jgi:DNA-binding CsgD family transcriptional regulator
VELDDFSRLVGQIYETSLDVSAWPETLAAACRFVGAPKSALGSYSMARRSYDIQFFAGYGDDWVALYRERYGAINPLAGSTNGQRIGEIKCLSAHGLIGAFDGQPMYEEWVKPQRILDIAELVLDATDSHAATLAFATHDEDGPLTSDNLRRFELLYPHVRRSILISRVLKMHRRGEAELSAVVDGLAAGVFILTGQARLLRSNGAGAAMLRACSLVAASGDTLRLKDPKADRALRDALRGAAKASSGTAGSGASIPLKNAAGRDFVAHVLPLSLSAAEGELQAPGGEVAVFVAETQPDLEQALKTFANAFGLTAAESRVARALAEIGSTPMVASALGVTVATVRSHLQRLYQKTGARRQAEIVSQLQGLASPFQ